MKSNWPRTWRQFRWTVHAFTDRWMDYSGSVGLIDWLIVWMVDLFIDGFMNWRNDRLCYHASQKKCTIILSAFENTKFVSLSYVLKWINNFYLYNPSSISALELNAFKSWSYLKTIQSFPFVSFFLSLSLSLSLSVCLSQSVSLSLSLSVCLSLCLSLSLSLSLCLSLCPTLSLCLSDTSGKYVHEHRKDHLELRLPTPTTHETSDSDHTWFWLRLPTPPLRIPTPTPDSNHK